MGQSRISNSTGVRFLEASVHFLLFPFLLFPSHLPYVLHCMTGWAGERTDGRYGMVWTVHKEHNGTMNEIWSCLCLDELSIRSKHWVLGRGICL